MPLNDRERLIYDKAFMAFGSMMKAVDAAQLDDEALMLYAEEAWKWSVGKVTELVDQLYNGTLPKADVLVNEQNGSKVATSPPPATPAPPTP